MINSRTYIKLIIQSDVVGECVCVEQPLEVIGQVSGPDLSNATRQRLQDGVVNEDVLVLRLDHAGTTCSHECDIAEYIDTVFLLRHVQH